MIQHKWSHQPVLHSILQYYHLVGSDPTWHVCFCLLQSHHMYKLNHSICSVGLRQNARSVQRVLQLAAASWGAMLGLHML
jgi:hypothetical protein